MPAPIKGPIEKALENKSPRERARHKAETFAGLHNGKLRFQRDGHPFTVSDWKHENGVLYVTVEGKSPDGDDLAIANPMAFVNPPVMVPDGTTRTELIEGGFVEVDNFREDPLEAAKQFIYEAALTSDRMVRATAEKKGVSLEEALTGDPTLTVYADAGDGFISNTSATYSTARSGGGSFITDSTATSDGRVIGQRFAAGSYRCIQSFFSFDTSSLGAGATISAAVFSLYGAADNSATDFTAEARLRDWGGTLADADYVAGASLSGDALLATFATSAGWSVAGYNDFTDVALPANVSKTGNTRLYVSSDRQRTNNTPVGDEAVGAYFADNSGTTNDPKLVVTYTAVTTVDKSLTDTGSGSDALSVEKSRLIALTDTGSGSDALAVEKQRLIALTDTGSGSDALSVEKTTVVDKALTDTGSGSDDLAVEKTKLVGLTDTGSGSDALAVEKTRLIGLTDTGTGTDALSVEKIYEFQNPTEVYAHMSTSIREASPDLVDGGATAGQPSIYLRLNGTVSNRVRGLLDVGYGVDLVSDGEVVHAEIRIPRPDSFSGNVTAEQIIESWTAETATWNNQPDVDASTAVVEAVTGSDDIVIDVTEMVVAALADPITKPWHGIRLSYSGAAEVRAWSSYASQEFRPHLELETNFPPDPPTGSKPAGGRYVSKVRPRLSTIYKDRNGEDSTTGIHIQIATDDAMETMVYDSGEVDATEPVFDLDDPPAGAAAVSDLDPDTDYYWHVKLRDSHGAWSEFGEISLFRIHSLPTLTITAPAAGSVTTPIPTITFTMTGIEQREIVVERRTVEGEPWNEVYREARNITGSLTFQVPTDARLEEGYIYRISVSGWDGYDREDLPGDRAFSSDSVELTLATAT